MQTQSSNWLEIVKAVAPYITAIVAIMVSALTAWMAHRNWMKQFLVEKTFVFRDEQRSLLKKIPSKLIQAGFLGVQSLVWQAILTAILRLISEEKVSRNEEKINLMHERHHQAVQQLSAMITEVYTFRITSRVYFGEDAGRAVESCLTKLQEITVPGPEYKAAESEIYAKFNTALEAGNGVPENMTEIILEMRQRMIPLIDRFGDEVAKLVRLMLVRIGSENPR